VEARFVPIIDQFKKNILNHPVDGALVLANNYDGD